METELLLKGDPRVSLRGRNERFTSNGATRPLRIRVHSNEPSRPCCLVNIFLFFSRFRLFVFFSSLFFCHHLGAERGVCKAIFNPFHASLFHFFSLLSFSFFVLPRRAPIDLFVFVLLFLLEIRENPRWNYAGFSSGDTERGGEKQN